MVGWEPHHVGTSNHTATHHVARVVTQKRRSKLPDSSDRAVKA